VSKTWLLNWLCGFYINMFSRCEFTPIRDTRRGLCEHVYAWIRWWMRFTLAEWVVYIEPTIMNHMIQLATCDVVPYLLTNEWTKKSRFNDVIYCTYVWVIYLRYKFIFEKMTMKHKIKRWLIRWIINNWVNIKFLFWSLNVCITNRDFSNALSISRWLISSTNRKLNMRTFIDTSLLLIDWKTSFRWVRWYFFVWMRRIEKVRCVRLNRI
jgi:hypothetical protein